MQVKNIDINIAEIGKSRLKEYADENGVISFPEFFKAYVNIDHIKKDNLTYFVNKHDFEKYFEMVEKCYTIATCKEMIEGPNSQAYLRIYQTLKLINNESSIINFVVEESLWKHYINIFPLWSLKALENFRVRVYIKHEEQYKIEYAPGANDVISFRESWLHEEKTRAEQLIKIIEKSKEPQNSRIERTVSLSTLKNYIIATEKALISPPIDEDFKKQRNQSVKDKILFDIWINKDQEHYQKVIEFLKNPNEETGLSFVNNDGKWIESIVLLGAFIKKCKAENYIGAEIKQALLERILNNTFFIDIKDANPLRRGHIFSIDQEKAFKKLPVKI